MHAFVLYVLCVCMCVCVLVCVYVCVCLYSSVLLELVGIWEHLDVNTITTQSNTEAQSNH